MYFGGHMNIITKDETMIKEIFIKNFSNFANRQVPAMFKYNCKLRKLSLKMFYVIIWALNQSLVQMSKEDGWKEVRYHSFKLFKLRI